MAIVTDLIISNEVPTGDIDGVNKVFTLTKAPNPEKSLELFLNGKLQVIDVDYTLYNLTITFETAPWSGSNLKIHYRYVDIAELYTELARITDAGSLAGMEEGDVDGSNINNDENWTDDVAAAAAQATADGKIVTFLQDAEPTADGVGDLWIDTNDTNKLYRWNGTNWILVTDTDIAQAILDAASAQTTADSKTDDTAADAAQATADSKIITFYQDVAPTAEATGDFWIDTNDNNKPYRWSGAAWVAIDNPVSDWSLVVDDDGNKPANNATENTGDLADKDTVDTAEIDDGAVLLQKLSATKRILMSCFESLDGWSSTGTIIQDFGNVNIRTTNVADNKAVLYTVPSNWVGLNWSKDFFWQASVKLNQITAQEIYFGMGATDYVGAYSAVGFKIVNNALYCFHAQESGGSLVYTTQIITGITLNSWNVYRFIHDQSAGTIKFYVNGVLKHTFSSSLPTSSDDNLASFQIKTTETTIKYLYVSDLLISIDR